jgi:hypothetical protein
VVYFELTKVCKGHLGALNMSSASICVIMAGDTVSVSTNGDAPSSYKVTVDPSGNLTLTLVPEQESIAPTVPRTLGIDASLRVRPRRDMQEEQAENAAIVERFFSVTGRESLDRAEVIDIAKQFRLVPGVDWEADAPFQLIAALVQCRKDWSSEGNSLTMTTSRWRTVWEDVAIKREERRSAGLPSGSEAKNFDAIRELLNDLHLGVTQTFLQDKSDSDTSESDCTYA